MQIHVCAFIATEVTVLCGDVRGYPALRCRALGSRAKATHTAHLTRTQPKMLRRSALILVHLWACAAASAAPASLSAWDQPFVVPPGLAEAMDSRTFPILRIVPIAREACLARLAKCMDAESIGTVWHMEREHDRADRLSMLHLGAGGRPLAFRALDLHHLLHVAIPKAMERTAEKGGMCTFFPLVADDVLPAVMKTNAQLQHTAGNPATPN